MKTFVKPTELSTTTAASTTTHSAHSLADTSSTPAPPPKLVFRCSTCHGQDILRDAWASWSVKHQEWQLGHVFDHAFCVTCEDDCTIESVPAAIAVNI